MDNFLETLRVQRWDDHRYYHHSRINQSLHLVSALSFLFAYVMIFKDPAVAALVGLTKLETFVRIAAIACRLKRLPASGKCHSGWQRRATGTPRWLRLFRCAFCGSGRRGPSPRRWFAARWPTN